MAPGQLNRKFGKKKKTLVPARSHFETRQLMVDPNFAGSAGNESLDTIESEADIDALKYSVMTTSASTVQITRLLTWADSDRHSNQRLAAVPLQRRKCIEIFPGFYDDG